MSHPSTLLQKPCPKCKQAKCVEIKDNILICTHASCSFCVSYCCPICDSSLDSNEFSDDKHGRFFNCRSCNNSIHIQRIKYLIDNRLHVDHYVKCDYCNAPTVHRFEANVGRRCLFFPRCSGQADLFGSTKESLVFIDFETTGLDAGSHYITEVGAVKIDEEGFIHTFESFIKVPISLDEKIVQITGITDEMLVDAPELPSVMRDLIDFIGDSTLIAHNAEFDLPWLIIAAKKSELEIRTNTIICTLKWARASKESGASLGALTKKYNIGHENAHRALADAAATKELFFIFDQKKITPRPIETREGYDAIASKIMSRAPSIAS
jgi:DNA polymerase III epsilon subunit family exonuclease